MVSKAPPIQPPRSGALEKEEQLQARDRLEIVVIEQKAREQVKQIEQRLAARRLRINFLQDHPGMDAMFKELLADGVFKEVIHRE